MNPFRVITARDAKRLNVKEDGYWAKVIKYIPSEIVAAYTALRGILLENNNDEYFGLIFWGCFILTPIYKYYLLKDPKLKKAWFQIIISAIAFGVWVFALGDYFELMLKEKYNHILASIILIFFTLSIPVLEKLVSNSDD